MRILVIVVLMSAVLAPSSYADPDTTAAVTAQTTKQTAEHLDRLAKTAETLKQLERQVKETIRLKELAERAADGIEGVDSINDFRNLAYQAQSLLSRFERYIDRNKEITGQWDDIFGSLVKESSAQQNTDDFENIDLSDEINSTGYSVADSYQIDYDRNVEQAQGLIENSKLVNEKGALKQIAESMGHLLQMQNHIVLLLSEQIKGQAVENSNKNLERKAEADFLKQENKRVNQFIHIVDSSTFGL